MKKMPNPTYDKMKQLLLKIEFYLTVYKKTKMLDEKQTLEEIEKEFKNAYPKGI